MDYDDGLEGVEDELDDVIDDFQHEQQQQPIQHEQNYKRNHQGDSSGTTIRRKRQTKHTRNSSPNNQDDVMNLVQGII